jgi:gliding motility-associated-like protein
VGAITYEYSIDQGTGTFGAFSTTNSVTASTIGNGTYRIKSRAVTSGGCVSNETTTSWTVVAAPTPLISGNLSYCIGQNTTLTASGGSSYAWSNSINTAAITVSTAGTYTVTVTGSGGCTATASATVNDATVTPSASASPTANTNCVAPFNGAVTLTTTGTAYSWSNGSSSQNLSGLAAATYTVTVTGAGGCTATASATVDDATVTPSASTSPTANTNCVAPFNGAVTLTSNGTSFVWSNSSITQNLTTVGAATYTVTVTGAGGCTATASATVNNATVNPSATAVANDNTNCIAPFSGSVNLTTTGISYLWSNGAITEDLSGLAAATYTVTVTGAGGCTATASATVNDATVTPSASASPTANSNCVAPFNGAVTLTTTWTAYSWSNGSSSQNLSGLAAATYTVTLTDAGGCTATASATVNDAIVTPSASTSPTANTNCVAPFNGAVTLTSNGTSFLWSNAAITQNLTTVGAATYTVTVTGAGGCTATVSATVNNATVNPTASAVTNDNTNCIAPFNGSVDLTTSATSFLWSNGAITEDLSAVNAGTYTVTVTGTGGCTASTSATVNNTTTNPTASAVASSNTSCIAPFNGSVDLTTSATSFLWSNGAITEDLSAVNAGTYSVTVTGTGGCTANASATVNDATVNPSASAVATSNTSCIVPFNGSVDLTTSGTSYIWSNTAVTEDLSALNAGTYSVTVTAANGCTATTSATVIDNTSIATSSDTRINCNSFTWIDGNTYFTSNNSATYTYTGGAVNGCDSIVTLDLIINYSDSTFENNSSCNPNDTGVFVFNLTNQYSCDSVHIITVLLLPADATFENRTTCDQSAVGVVTLNLLNQFGCDSVHTITTTLSPADATFENQSTCDPNAVGTFTFNYTNRFGCDSAHSITYTLSPAQSSNVFVNLCRGNSVFAGGGLQTTDGTYVDNLFTTQGCDSTVTTYVTVSELPIVSISVPQDTIIRGESIVLSAVSNVAVSTYLWNPPTALSCDQCQNPTASPNSNIIYILNITDVNGCSANAFTRITVLSDSCDKNIFIPSAFSPNGDGNNDVFQIYGNCIASMKISIFNRWGELVFESNDINQGWDGVYKGAAQIGVYTYTLSVEFKDGRKDNRNERRGSITLVK